MSVESSVRSNTQSDSATDKSLNQTNEAQALGKSNQESQDELLNRKNAIKNVDTDLGEVEGLTGTVSNTIGSVIEALVPRDRDTAGISFSLKIPVHPAVKINIGLSGTAMRLGERILLATSVSIGARMGTDVDLFWAEFEAYLQVAGEGYLKTIADNPKEGFEFIALGIREIIANHSETIAGLMMSKEERAQVISDMSDSEFVELGLGVSVEAGTNFKTENNDAAMTGVSASGKFLSGTKFTNSNNDRDLEQTETGKIEASVSANFDLSKFGIPSLSGSSSVSMVLAYTEKKLDWAKVSFGVSTKLTPNFDATMLVGIFADMITTMAKTIADSQKMFGGEGSVLIGKIGRATTGLAIGDEIAAGAVEHLSDSMSVNFKHAFSVGVKWSPKDGCELELSLSKTANVEKSIGDVASLSASMGESILSKKIPFEL